MSILLEGLKPRERRGSKPRCHLLTHGSPEAIAARLTALVAPFASVAPADRWMPQGFEDTAEATLPEAEHLLPADVRLKLLGAGGSPWPRTIRVHQSGMLPAHAQSKARPESC